MDFKIFPPFPSSPGFPGSDEVITNRWPLPRSPEEIHPEGIPILFGKEQVSQLAAKPIAWPCDDATDRWILKNSDEPFPITPEDPEPDQSFEF